MNCKTKKIWQGIMTNKRHLGNGNIEIKLETKENIPYCLELIKQALEKQMEGRNRQ